MPAAEGNKRCRFLTAFALLMTAYSALAQGLPPNPQAPPARTGTMEKYVPSAQELQAAYQRLARRGRGPTGVYKDKITPHWFQNNRRFWYRNDLRGGYRQFVVVDVQHGVR